MVKLLKELPELKGIIFDLDGTLLDSMFMWQEIDREYFESHGHSFDPQLSEIIKHLPFDECATFFKDILQLDKSEDMIISEWKEMAHHKYATSIQLKDGAYAFLKAMKDNNIKMFIVTSCVKEHALAALKRLNILSYFEDIYFCLELNMKKNEPEVFVNCVNNNNLKPQECLVIEDLYRVLEMVKREGFYTCGIYDVLSTDQIPLFINNCDYYIESFEQLLK